VQALQQESDQWEKKYEEMAEKYNAVTKELEEFRREIEGL
jgi:tropomyosin